MLLVIDAGREAWYLAYGGSIRPYVEDETVSPALPHPGGRQSGQ